MGRKLRRNIFGIVLFILLVQFLFILPHFVLERQVVLEGSTLIEKSALLQRLEIENYQVVLNLTNTVKPANHTFHGKREGFYNGSRLFWNNNSRTDENFTKVDNHSHSHYSLTKYGNAKLTALKKQVSELVIKYQRESYKLQSQKRENSICQRYRNEGKLEKIAILNVWRQFLEPNKKDSIFVSTQMHEGKFTALERFVHNWDGGMSIALYVNVSTVFNMSRMIAEKYPAILEKRNIDIHLVAKHGQFYPINYLRNTALKNTDAPYVFLCDIDFTPNFGLYKYLQKMVASELHNDEILRALVIPAFEFAVPEDVTSYPKNKKELLGLWSRGNVHIFHSFFPLGHNRTNYQRWKNATCTYTIEYEDSYEPYLVMKRKQVPDFDERFLGRYKNKVSHRYEIATMGAEFVVLPEAFLIHYPHHLIMRVPYETCSMRLYLKFKWQTRRKYKHKSKSKHIVNKNVVISRVHHLHNTQIKKA